MSSGKSDADTRREARLARMESACPLTLADYEEFLHLSTRRESEGLTDAEEVCWLELQVKCERGTDQRQLEEIEEKVAVGVPALRASRRGPSRRADMRCVLGDCRARA